MEGRGLKNVKLKARLFSASCPSRLIRELKCAAGIVGVKEIEGKKAVLP